MLNEQWPCHLIDTPKISDFLYDTHWWQPIDYTFVQNITLVLAQFLLMIFPSGIKEDFKVIMTKNSNDDKQENKEK